MRENGRRRFMAGAVTTAVAAGLPVACKGPSSGGVSPGPAPSGGGAPPSTGATAGVEVVDLHAHFFNMFYLPVVGALTAVCVPEWAAKAIHALLKDIAGDPDKPLVLTASAAKERSDAIDAADEKVDADDEVAARDAVARIVRPEAFGDPNVLPALDRMASPVTRLLPEGRVKALFPEEQRVRTGRFGLAPRGDELVSRLAEDRDSRRLLARGVMDHLNWDTFKWMYLLTKPEPKIMEKLEKTFPAVKLFVHSMMDMDLHYGFEPPHYQVTAPPWAPDSNDPVSRTARFVADPGHGRFVALVAWDPFRERPLEIVKAAIETKGFKGVKFYPSNGFRPIDNVADVVKPMDPKVVDRNNLDLYRYCVEKGVPIFAHCALGDMQSRPGLDACADPKWWRKALEYKTGAGQPFRELRLCFAHAGGASNWALPPIQDDDFANSWAGQVHALCTDPQFPNVYADFGMFTVVLDDQKRDWLAERLERLFAATDSAGKPTGFADRACYGSDWSMLYRTKDQGKYLDRFREMFARPRLAPYAARFFGQNARTFLRL